MTLAGSVRAALESRGPDGPLLLDTNGSMMTTRAILGSIDSLTALLRSAGLDEHARIAVVVPNGMLAAVTALGVMTAAAFAPINPRYGDDELAGAVGDLAADALITDGEVGRRSEHIAADAGLAIIRVQLDASALRVIPTIIRHSSRCRPVAEHASEPDDRRFCLLLHTSGTTATPKLIGLTEANVLASASAVATTLGLSASDRVLNVMPLFHIHGLVGSLLASVVGHGSVVCTSGFDAFAFRRQLGEPGVTWTTAVPSMYRALVLRHRNAISSSSVDPSPGPSPESEQTTRRPLRFVRSSSATMPEALWNEVEALLCCPLINAYGMTEASHQMTSNPIIPGERRIGTVGRGAGAEVAIAVHNPTGAPVSGLGSGPHRSAPTQSASDVDETSVVTQAAGCVGEVVIRGPGVMGGYLAPEGANEHAWIQRGDGRWFRTGDLGEFDSDGYLRLVGRIKEIINVAGEKVSPFEVEAVLMRHPAVADAVAFAVPDGLRGERVCAAVTLQAAVPAETAAVLTTDVAPGADLTLRTAVAPSTHEAVPSPTATELRRFAATHLAKFKTPEQVVIVDNIPLGPTGKVQRSRMANLLADHLSSSL